MPRVVDSRARAVGIQVWKEDDSWARNGVVGEQCGGNDCAIIEGMGEKDAIMSFEYHQRGKLESGPGICTISYPWS